MAMPPLIVSKRVESNKPNAGGLVEALKGLEGDRLGWDGTVTDSAEITATTHIQPDGRKITTFPLPRGIVPGYGRVCNIDKWGAGHGIAIGVPSSENAIRDYKAAEAIFAQQTARIVKPGQIIRLDDFQIEGVAAEARKLGLDNPMGHVRHIPVPDPDTITAPVSRLMRRITDHDLICVQTIPDLARLNRLAVEQWGAQPVDHSRMATQWQVGSRLVRLAHIPATITFDDIAQRDYSIGHRNEFTKSVFKKMKGREFWLGLDRMDPAKGLIDKFRGVERYFERHPAMIGKAVLIQFAPASREELEEYRGNAFATRREAARINKRFGAELIVLYDQGIEGDQKHHVMRHAAMGLFTPLRDGMNLVMKEFVAAQDPRNPHMQVISRFAGAARQLWMTPNVDPRDPDAIADQIEYVRSMSLAERQRVHQAETVAVKSFQNKDYAAAFTEEMAAVAEDRARRGSCHVPVIGPAHRATIGKPSSQLRVVGQRPG